MVIVMMIIIIMVFIIIINGHPSASSMSSMSSSPRSSEFCNKMSLYIDIQISIWIIYRLDFSFCIFVRSTFGLIQFKCLQCLAKTIFTRTKNLCHNNSFQLRKTPKCVQTIYQGCFSSYSGNYRFFQLCKYLDTQGRGWLK